MVEVTEDSSERYLVNAESISRCARVVCACMKRRAVPMWAARRSVGVGEVVWDSGVWTVGVVGGGS